MQHTGKQSGFYSERNANQTFGDRNQDDERDGWGSRRFRQGDYDQDEEGSSYRSAGGRDHGNRDDGDRDRGGYGRGNSAGRRNQWSDDPRRGQRGYDMQGGQDRNSGSGDYDDGDRGQDRWPDAQGRSATNRTDYDEGYDAGGGYQGQRDRNSSQQGGRQRDSGQYAQQGNSGYAGQAGGRAGQSGYAQRGAGQGDYRSGYSSQQGGDSMPSAQQSGYSQGRGYSGQANDGGWGNHGQGNHGQGNNGQGQPGYMNQGYTSQGYPSGGFSNDGYTGLSYSGQGNQDGYGQDSQRGQKGQSQQRQGQRTQGSQGSYGMQSGSMGGAAGRHLGGFGEQGYWNQGDGARGHGGDRARDLSSRAPKGYTRSDERVKEDICERLMQEPDIDASEVSVEVKNGKVTFEGSVVERRMKHALEDVAESCSGVKDIDNKVRVSPRNSQASNTSSEDRSQSSTTDMPGNSQKGRKET